MVLCSCPLACSDMMYARVEVNLEPQAHSVAGRLCTHCTVGRRTHHFIKSMVVRLLFLPCMCGWTSCSTESSVTCGLPCIAVHMLNAPTKLKKSESHATAIYLNVNMLSNWMVLHQPLYAKQTTLLTLKLSMHSCLSRLSLVL